MKKKASLQTLSILLASLFFFSSPSMRAQTNFNVSTAADLSNAVSQAYSDTVNNNWTDTITLQGDISSMSQFILNANVNIVGNDHSIDMNNADRAFFIAGGTVNISGLTFENGNATGGNGVAGGGGGAGLGGAIFVAQSGSIPGVTPLPATSLSLTNVFFVNNQAVGGNGGTGYSWNNPYANGGGGGMGGNGGGSYYDNYYTAGGGGGGFGVGANGGAGSSSGTHGSAGALIVSSSSGGGGGSGSGNGGGAYGGGGGGGDSGVSYDGAGGGGGAGGASASGSFDDIGGAGGFGGGGGGGGYITQPGGKGGFGGGGGAGNSAGNGGFGGGGGGMAHNGYTENAGSGGFGGGLGLQVSASDSPDNTDSLGLGGGGAGLGGGIFVMGGASLQVAYTGNVATSLFTNNSVTGGQGGSPSLGGLEGAAYGPNIFLGSDVTYNVTSSTIFVTGLGGAANTSDYRVANFTNDPNVNGGIIKNGSGTLVLSGWNTYSGPTTVNQGVLATTGSQAAMPGTSAITINSGGTLQLGQSNGANNSAPVTLNGGILQLSVPVTQTFGTLTISAPSILDFARMTNSSLSFASLNINAPLAIWDYVPVVGALNVLSGTYTGNLSNITFYSDNGLTSMGQAYLSGTLLTPSTMLVTNGTQLASAITAANAMPIGSTIILGTNAVIQPSSQQVISLNSSNTGGLTIQGNGAEIDMSQANGGSGDRAFFVAGGSVTLSNMTIANGVARGGAGVDGGGGGAGLGGAIFAAAGNQIPSSTITLPTHLTLADVTFTNNMAAGGAGAALTYRAAGGGGGLGGQGGSPSSNYSAGGGGGGGFGFGANGGTAGSGMPGAAIFTPSGGGSSSSGENGGANGGGGGGADTSQRSGGGGGIAGQSSSTLVDSPGNGGWGGGGGGAAFAIGYGAGGGFGGGGGGGYADAANGNGTFGGSGGFGGGGGYGLYVPQSGGFGSGGFGGGQGAEASTVGGPGGGGGLGAGGAIFAMAGASVTIQGGSFASNSVVAGMSEGNLDNGSAAMNGSAYGSDLFLGVDVTFNVTNGSSLSVNSLGGAGNLSDPNVSNNATDPNAQGGIIKTGSGTLTMTGSNYFTGATTLHQGAVVLGGGALEQGTSQVIVGQANGDNATFILGSSSTLNVSYGTNPAVIVGQNAGSTGTIVIGSGPGSGGAFVGANVFQGGVGGGRVVFSQNNAAGDASPSVYPFLTALTGNLQVVQNGPGTTLLLPLATYGPNTFTGGIVVNQGTLQLGTNTALPSGNAITLNGGVFDLNGNSASAGVLTLNGGTLTNSGGNQAITPTITVTTSGVIVASIAGLGGLAQQGAGTTTISSPTGFTGATTVQQGTLMALVSGALGGTTNLTVESGGIFTLGASNAVNPEASLLLQGGTLNTVSNLSQNLGAWTLQNTSTLDFAGNTVAFNFSGLSINGTLAIWNWNALTDSIGITGAYSGDLSQIIFYSDFGVTEIGTGAIVNNQLQAVPEPSTYALVCLSALLLVISARRRAVESI